MTRVFWFSFRVWAILTLSVFCSDDCGAQKPPKPVPEPPFWIVFDQIEVPSFSTAQFPYVDIFVMDQDGHRTKRLTSNHRSHNPTWSPDGRQIAYLADERAPLATATSNGDYDVFMQFRDFMSISRDVFRMDADGRNPAHIVSVGPDAQDVLMFPDGKRFGIRKSDRGALRVVVDPSGKFLLAVQSGEPLDEYLNMAQRLLSGGFDASYRDLRVWVPPLDNFMPTFVSSRGFSPEFYDRPKSVPAVANLTASLRVMPFDGTSLPIPIPAFDIAWSLDGKRIAYSAFSGGQNSILYVGEMKGEEVETNRRALTDQSLDAHGPAWSADGSRIAFTGLWEESSQIFVVGADGTNLIQLSNNPKLYCYHVSWSPDGKWIVADCRPNVTLMRPFTYELGGLSNIYLFDVSKPGTKPHQLTKCAPIFPLPNPTCGTRNPSFAPAKIATP